MNRDQRYTAYMGVMIGLLAGLMLLLGGCATPDDAVRDDLETKHLAWSNKTTGWASQVKAATVTMNHRGLMVLYVDGVAVAHRKNWCVEIVELVE